MTFQNAVRTCFQKYLDIEGRASRSEYWWFVLFGLLGGIILSFIDAMFFGFDGLTPLSTVFSVLLFIPYITVGVRRLHDRDMSGWWLLLMLLPLIGSFILLILFIFPGTPGSNRFGPDPIGGGSSSRLHQPERDDQEYSQSSIPKVDRD